MFAPWNISIVADAIRRALIFLAFFSEFFSSFKILNALSAIKNSGIMDNIEDADKFVATLEDIGVPKPVVDGISVVLNMVAIKDKVNGFVNGIKDKLDYLF